MQKKINSHAIANLSIYVALMTILTFVPYTGYWHFGPISVTILPVFIAIATWHLGWTGGMTTSIAFGLGSYLKALAGMGSPLFANYPELAIIPRLLVGVTISFVVSLLKDIRLWKVVFTSGLVVFANTLYVTVWFILMKEYRNASELSTFKAWIVLIYINFFVELGLAIFFGLVTYKMVVYLKDQNKSKKLISY